MIIARRIISDIDQQGLGPGDHLPSEKVMLEHYQVGRGTLRESLRFLELSGAISLKPGPGGGPIVEKPEASHLMNSLGLLLQFEGAQFATIVEARVGLEPLMARLAAERITDELRVRLEGAVALMRESTTDLEVFLEANREFHNTIAWASGNPLFGFLIDAMDGVFAGSSLSVDYPVQQRLQVLKADQAIFDAIMAGDPDEAEGAMRLHVSEWTNYLHTKSPDALARPITWDAMQ
ncbi:FadR family transcriptional regulator [Rhodococcus spelaei]|uniref:FadR family transcriptional regulator n=1 Tax=Rhodococcus spelaei TaxID=2546320 RepID=A0A541BAC5_9NOCA|nr:FCD domain-containing protein [Rhodococcus spelaei]TQF69277.1 FadR family transcriptional regulator [Rhodococcus spelaei]